MNRTERLYAIVEELRARSPRPTSATKLAARFEVSARTIERDLLGLQESGVPIYAETGRRGGYVLDASRTLPSVNFTPAEAAAIAIALSRREATPFTKSARAALTKILNALSDADLAAAHELGARVLLYEPATSAPPPAEQVVPRVLEQAIVERRVLRIDYVDKDGRPSGRTIEPHAVVGMHPNWYLAGWCRLREGVRMFRLDRIRDAVLTREIAPHRTLPPIEIPDYQRRATFE